MYIINHGIDLVFREYTSLSTRAPSQYPKRRLFVRSRKVSKPRDLYLESSDRSEIWQALRQQCCRCACQISKQYDNLKYQSRDFETLRDLTKRRLFGYWDGAQKGWLIGPLKKMSYILQASFSKEHTLMKMFQFHSFLFSGQTASSCSSGNAHTSKGIWCFWSVWFNW